ncbi:hypothetical protein AAMO2058_001006400 [Amorphochlora amoebiformis]
MRLFSKFRKKVKARVEGYKVEHLQDPEFDGLRSTYEPIGQSIQNVQDGLDRWMVAANDLEIASQDFLRSMFDVLTGTDADSAGIRQERKFSFSVSTKDIAREMSRRQLLRPRVPSGRQERANSRKSSAPRIRAFEALKANKEIKHVKGVEEQMDMLAKTIQKMDVLLADYQQIQTDIKDRKESQKETEYYMSKTRKIIKTIQDLEQKRKYVKSSIRERKERSEEKLNLHKLEFEKKTRNLKEKLTNGLSSKNRRTGPLLAEILAAQGEMSRLMAEYLLSSEAALTRRMSVRHSLDEFLQEGFEIPGSHQSTNPPQDIAPETSQDGLGDETKSPVHTSNTPVVKTIGTSKPGQKSGPGDVPKSHSGASKSGGNRLHVRQSTFDFEEDKGQRPSVSLNSISRSKPSTSIRQHRSETMERPHRLSAFTKEFMDRLSREELEAGDQNPPGQASLNIKGISPILPKSGSPVLSSRQDRALTREVTSERFSTLVGSPPMVRPPPKFRPNAGVGYSSDTAEMLRPPPNCSQKDLEKSLPLQDPSPSVPPGSETATSWSLNAGPRAEQKSERAEIAEIERADAPVLSGEKNEGFRGRCEGEEKDGSDCEESHVQSSSTISRQSKTLPQMPTSNPPSLPTSQIPSVPPMPKSVPNPKRRSILEAQKRTSILKAQERTDEVDSKDSTETPKKSSFDDQDAKQGQRALGSSGPSEAGSMGPLMRHLCKEDNIPDRKQDAHDLQDTTAPNTIGTDSPFRPSSGRLSSENMFRSRGESSTYSAIVAGASERPLPALPPNALELVEE